MTPPADLADPAAPSEDILELTEVIEDGDPDVIALAASLDDQFSTVSTAAPATAAHGALDPFGSVSEPGGDLDFDSLLDDLSGGNPPIAGQALIEEEALAEEEAPLGDQALGGDEVLLDLTEEIVDDTPVEQMPPVMASDIFVRGDSAETEDMLPGDLAADFENLETLAADPGGDVFEDALADLTELAEPAETLAASPAAGLSQDLPQDFSEDLSEEPSEDLSEGVADELAADLAPDLAAGLIELREDMATAAIEGEAGDLYDLDALLDKELTKLSEAEALLSEDSEDSEQDAVPQPTDALAQADELTASAPVAALAGAAALGGLTAAGMAFAAGKSPDAGGEKPGFEKPFLATGRPMSKLADVRERLQAVIARMDVLDAQMRLLGESAAQAASTPAPCAEPSVTAEALTGHVDARMAEILSDDSPMFAAFRDQIGEETVRSVLAALDEREKLRPEPQPASEAETIRRLEAQLLARLDEKIPGIETRLFERLSESLENRVAEALNAKLDSKLDAKLSEKLGESVRAEAARAASLAAANEAARILREEIAALADELAEEEAAENAARAGADPDKDEDL